MALDPGIFQLLNTKGGPASNLAAVRDYENAGIQGQLGQAQIQRVGLENQQLQQEMALRPDALKLRQAQADAAIQENLAKMDKAKLDKTNAWNTRAGQIWASVSDEPSYQRAKAAIRQEALANGVQIPEGYDPHPPAYDPGFVRQEVEKSMTMDQRIAQEAARRIEAKTQQDFEFRGSQFEETKRHNRAMEARPTTVFSPNGVTASVGDPASALAKLSASDQAIVKQLASRQLLVGRAGGFQINNPRNQALYGLAIQLNPNLNVVDNAAYQDFVKDLAKSSATSAGGRVDSGNRMLGHAGDLIDALKKLNPGSGTMGRIGNVISYPSEKAFGNRMAAVSFIKSKLIAEANKLVTGGVPHAQELADDIKNMPDTATKEQWGSVIKAIADVGLEQVMSTEEKRNNFLGKMAPKTSLLSERAEKNLSKIYKYAGEEPPKLLDPSGSGYTRTAAGGSETPKLSPEEAAKLPSGTKFIGLDGIERTKR